MKDTAKFLAVSIVVVLILVWSVACEVSVWRECRQHNSWWYCMRVLSK